LAIAIEGLSIVVRLDRAAELLPGGIDALAHEGNGSAGKDSYLWRCCFMADVDGEALFERLRARGLNAAPGPDPDMVLVNEFDLEVHPYCEWLVVSRVERAVIAWIAGTTPETVIATSGWSFEKGSGLQRAQENDAHLKFLRVEVNGLEVYFDENAQKEVYIARNTPSAEALDWRFVNGAKHISKVEPGQPAVTGRRADEIRSAIDELEIVATHAPESWQTHFMIGKGWQAVGELQKAFDSLRRANELTTDNESLPREFAGLCLDMGLADEAVQAGERAASLKPDNHETLGNLACAYLIGGKYTEASRSIDAALRLQPADPINQNLRGIIADVVSGRRPQPKCLKDLMRVPKKSFWERFKFW
jgi:tetratricopeptide (TPR) repeat protein